VLLTAQFSIQLPEPFIWLTFRGLAEALYVLHTGYAIPAAEPDRPSNIENGDLPLAPEWSRRYNVDIKPPNVVVTEPDAEWPYPAFKVAKMIDFGLVYTERVLAEHHKQMGTGGFRPPVCAVLCREKENGEFELISNRNNSEAATAGATNQ
jgi:hypothetical protein